jgi:4-carboxymuconolactone decarboxylase
MTRIPPISDPGGLDAEARLVYERIVESRGAIGRPFQVLLHAPRLAGAVAELGHAVRFESHLEPADRELVTLATGRVTGCAFVWESHVDGAVAAGVGRDTIAALERGDDGALDDRARPLVALVRDLCAGGEVDDERFDAVHDLVGGLPGVVELVGTVAYYAMLSTVMRAFRAC